MKRDESTFQEAVADQKSDAKPIRFFAGSADDVTVEELKEFAGGDRSAEFHTQFFSYDHLPAHLQDISRPFALLASIMLESLPANPSRTLMLVDLIRAKDHAVRAKLAK